MPDSKPTIVKVRMNGQDLAVAVVKDEKGDFYAPDGLHFTDDDPTAQDAMNEALSMRNIAESHKAPVLPASDGGKKVQAVHMPIVVTSRKDETTGLP